MLHVVLVIFIMGLCKVRTTPQDDHRFGDRNIMSKILDFMYMYGSILFLGSKIRN